MANMSALAVNTSTLNAATRVLLRMASTRAPAGTWLAIELTVPTESATPMAVCVQLWPAEIDRDERTEPGLNVGDEQIEPVEPAARRRILAVAGGAVAGTRRGRLTSWFGRRLQHRAQPEA